MPDLVRTEANDSGNPRVLFAWQPANVGDNAEVRGGYFQPITTLSFRILRPDGSELVAATVVDTALPANQLDRTDEHGKGRIYILPFAVDAAEPVGIYTAEVTFIVTPMGGSPLSSQVETFTFRVLDESQPFVDGAYAQIQDMLDNGFPVGNLAPTCGGFTFVDAVRALRRATDYVEMITSRTFDARYLSLDEDGTGGPVIQTEKVIIGLTDTAFTFTTFTPADLPIEEGDLRVYNRHIRQNMTEPDDRQDPRVEFLRSPVYRFPRAQLLGEVDILSSFIGFTDSQQNVKFRGMFGYTDFDGSAFGKTPELIKEATLRLAARYIQPLWAQMGGAGSNMSKAGPVKMEKTEDQQVQYTDAGITGGNNAFIGNFSGDPEIDQLLVLFMAPPKFGSA